MEIPVETLRRRAFIRRLAEPVNLGRKILREARTELGPDVEDALRTILVNEYRATGRPPGDKPTKAENRRIIELLRQISKRCAGKPVGPKELAPEGRSPERWAKNQRTQIRRFCLCTYRVWREAGFPDLRVPWFRESLRSQYSKCPPTGSFDLIKRGIGCILTINGSRNEIPV